MNTNGYLVLENGEVYEGQFPASREKIKPRIGEVVFNTSHSGYEEIATDPSYFNQIVVMTAPMMGNYGSNKNIWESKKFWIEGFVCLEIQNSVRENTWVSQLQAQQIPALTGIDTRKLVFSLREKGTTWGAILAADNEKDAREMAQELLKNKIKEKDWVYLASRKSVEKIVGNKPSGPRLAVLDFGTKSNILRLCAERASELTVFPSRTDAAEILKGKFDALILTNGPGDPADVVKAPYTVKDLIGKIPIFGICMGHQILGIAAGAKTTKLKYGHRGSNHPIEDKLLRKIYVTSQNHGYVISKESLHAEMEVSHINLNDQSIAGVFNLKKKYLGVQFHPEACPGPRDSQGLFDYFMENFL